MKDLKVRTQTDIETQVQYVGTYCLLPALPHVLVDYRNAGELKDGVACTLHSLYTH